jgi:hypothetical protein
MTKRLLSVEQTVNTRLRLTVLMGWPEADRLVNRLIGCGSK